MKYPITGDLLTPENTRAFKSYCKSVGSDSRAATSIIQAGLAALCRRHRSLVARRGPCSAPPAPAPAPAPAPEPEPDVSDA